MGLSLKDINRVPLAALMTANLALFYAFTQSGSLVHGQWGKLLMDGTDALKGVGAVTFIGLLNAQFSQEMKARIVFWRWKNPLPGSEAFSKHAHNDPRVDMVALERTCGLFPTAAKQQNALWYKLYKSVSADESVKQVHREFLFSRDYACLSLMAIPILGGLGFALAPLKAAGIYIILLILQFLFASRAARHHGMRFVTIRARLCVPQCPKAAPHAFWQRAIRAYSHVTPYLAAEALREQEAITGAKDALARGDLKQAARIAAEYHYNDVFGKISLCGEIRADGQKMWVNEAKRPEIRAKEFLKRLEIYQGAKKRRPAPFKHVADDIFNEAADVCTWSSLQLGKSDRRAEAQRTVLELWGWRANKDNLISYKDSEARGIITGVKILCGDGCPVAKAHENKVYPVAKAPELPLVGCTREPCCSCTYTAQVKDF